MTTPIDPKDRQIADLTARLAEAEETLRAIRGGAVDALVVASPQGDQVFTLQGAETPYRLLVEAMNEAALMLAPDGTVLYANARFAELARTPFEQVAGSSWKQYFPAHEHPRIEEFLAAAPRHGSRGELALQTGDGALLPVQLSLRSMRREGVEGFSVVLADLTDRKAIEAELRKAHDDLEAHVRQLQEMVAELEQYSYSISHDMRGPLRSMSMFSQMLLQDHAHSLDATGRDYLRRIASAAKRLDSLIQDVLAYSRLSRAEMKLEPVDLDTLVNEIIQQYPNLQSAQARFAVHRPLLPVLANRAALTQCLSNLLGNAVKFVAPGETPRVSIWTERREGQVRVWVADEGIGIEAAQQDRIWGIFERIHNRETYEGTGIGLSIVKKAVERMGGKIGVESEPDKGSRFWFQLPPA